MIGFIRRSPVYSAWIAFLFFTFSLGVISIIYVLINGLEVTNLTNALPWGLWITLDLSAIALGAGAFTLSAAVYLFGLDRFESVARAAVFIGMLGYSSAMIALFIDIGRPDRFYHPLIYWNIHSVLWEITLCVVLYTTVLLMEVIPIVIESTNLRNNRFLNGLAHWLHRIMPVAALVGMGLSLLHQSSLGATYGVLTARPVWFSPSAPVMFILSAIASGIALTITVTLVSGSLLRKHLVPPDVMNMLARFAGFMSLAYLYLKVWSWAATNYYSHTPSIEQDLELLAENTPYGFTFWWFEIILGALVPAIIFLWPRTRRSRVALIIAGGLSVFGLIVFRWNMTLSGFVVPLDWMPGSGHTIEINTYVPNLIEWLVAAGIVAYWLLAWSLAVRFLNIYPEAVTPGESPVTETPVAPVEPSDAAAPSPAS